MSAYYLVAKVAVSSAIYSIDKPYDYLVPEEMEPLAVKGRRVIVPFGRGNRKSKGFIIGLERCEQTDKLKSLLRIYDDDIMLREEDISLAMWMRRRCFCTFFEAASALLPPGIWSQSERFSPADMSMEEALAQTGRSKLAADIVRAVYTADKPLVLSEIEKRLEGKKTVSSVLRRLTGSGLIICTNEFDAKARDKYIWSVSLNMPLEQAYLQAGSGRYSQKRLEALECAAQAGALPEKELSYLTGVSKAIIRRMAAAGIFKLEKVEVYRRPKVRKEEAAEEISLNPEQAKAFEGIKRLLDGVPHAALLKGVTGSGKTEIYIKLIKEVRKRGGGAVVLLPEIALTPQMVRKFILHFKDEVAVIHSALTYAQRYDEYKRIKNGAASVVIGTRSAVFAPVNKLGIIIIDEEQETTYKAENTPRYHARDVAKYRAARNGCLLLMGSATPSVDSYYKALSGRYELFELNTRFNSMPLPKTIIADMREAAHMGDISGVGAVLSAEIRKNLDRREQTILFLNRRGSAKMVMCIDCGYVPQCENCSAALVYHSANDRLMCHHCGFSLPALEHCPNCGGHNIKYVGSGTQRIEDELKAEFPEIRILRMDADTTTERTSHERLLDKFAEGNADLLLGTQMVSKGLDFENVTLVGVLDADISLYAGDYHAQERTFSLLAQVVGRAGRREKPGRAVIQTYTPYNQVIQAAADQDYETFYRYEIDTRMALNAPPFCDIFAIMLTGTDERTVLKAALALTAFMDKAFKGPFSDLKTPVLGPVAPQMARLNKRYRYMITFRGKYDKRSGDFINRIVSAFYASPYSRAVSITADINPYDMV